MDPFYDFRPRRQTSLLRDRIDPSHNRHYYRTGEAAAAAQSRRSALRNDLLGGGDVVVEKYNKPTESVSQTKKCPSVWTVFCYAVTCCCPPIIIRTVFGKKKFPLAFFPPASSLTSNASPHHVLVQTEPKITKKMILSRKKGQGCTVCISRKDRTGRSCAVHHGSSWVLDIWIYADSVPAASTEFSSGNDQQWIYRYPRLGVHVGVLERPPGDS